VGTYLRWPFPAFPAFLVWGISLVSSSSGFRRLLAVSSTFDAWRFRVLVSGPDLDEETLDVEGRWGFGGMVDGGMVDGGYWRVDAGGW
jgi:hypothetical protein